MNDTLLKRIDNLLKEQTSKEYIAVDLDGTLAFDHGRKYDPSNIGEPVPEMVRRVKRWLDSGKSVKIFTARVAEKETRAEAEKAIKKWCKTYIGRELPITNEKDRYMLRLWDDRAVCVYRNRGLIK